MRLRILLALLVGWLPCAAPVYAASPWYIDAGGSGKPYTWSNGYLPWYLEDGGLGPLSSKQALQIVQDAFVTWKQAGLIVPGLIKVQTTALNPTQVGVLGTQVTKENIADVIKSKTVIVFDNDGSILSQYADPTDVAAMTFIGKEKNDGTLTLKAGVTILSGKFLEKADPSKMDTDPYVALFRATVIHELGHLLNVDHSALNQDLEGNIKSDPSLAQAVPTMYPIILTPWQKDLHDDDVVAISNLYPLSDYTGKFCTIAGQIVGSNKIGFQGALVIARSKLDPLTEAVSGVTGNNFPKNTADGSYFLRGIRPGRKYIVEYGEINPNFVGGSSIGPFGADDGELPKGNFGQGQVLGGGGKLKEVSCEKGGQTIVMDTVQLSVEATGNPPKSSQVPTVPSPSTSSDSSSGGGGCSLVVFPTPPN